MYPQCMFWAKILKELFLFVVVFFFNKIFNFFVMFSHFFLNTDLDSKAAGDIQPTPRDKRVKFQQDKIAKDKQSKTETSTLFYDSILQLNWVLVMLMFIS